LVHGVMGAGGEGEGWEGRKAKCTIPTILLVQTSFV
jgi:hypothetical protein